MADFVHASFQQLTEATLLRPVTVDGISMQAGAKGVIMAVYADGLAYEVEFTDPRVVLTIEGQDMTALISFTIRTLFVLIYRDMLRAVIRYDPTADPFEPIAFTVQASNSWSDARCVRPKPAIHVH